MGKITTLEINNVLVRAKVVGAFSAGNANLNSSIIFTTSKSVEKVSNLTGYNGFEINLNNSFKSYRVYEDINPKIMDKYPSLNGMVWQDQNKMINDLFTVEQASVFIIQFFTAIAVSFSLATITFLNTKRKISQIGILKAQGLSPAKTSLIFIYQFIIYSVLGISIGISLGNLYGKIFKSVVVSSEGKEILNIPTTFFNPASLISMGIILGGLIIANIYPLIITRKLKVVEIIKAE